MSKRSRSRRRQDFKPAFQQYVITDRHTRLRVVLAFGAFFQQLVRIGWIEQTGKNTGRLAPHLALDSAELAPNGFPQLRSLDLSTGPSIKSSWELFVERAWLIAQYGPITTNEGRQMEIEREIQTWGLPPRKPQVISRQWAT